MKPRPARYGKPWEPNELKAVAKMYVGGLTLKEICKLTHRPGEGVLAKLEGLSFLRKAAVFGPYPDQWEHSFPPEKREEVFAAICADAQGPFHNAAVTRNCADYVNYGLKGAMQRYRSLRDSGALLPVESSPYIVPRCCTLEAVPLNPIGYQADNTTGVSKMQNITIDNTIPHQDLTLIFGKQVKDMTDTDYLNAIRTMETQIANLKSVKTDSKKIKASIKDLETQLAKIVAAYDAT